MKKIRKGFQRIIGMYQIHGLEPVISFYLSKFYPFKWLCQQFSGRWLIRVKIHNSEMYLDALDPGISTNLLTEGSREPGHVAQVQANIKSGMSGIDLGSNIGFYALMEGQLTKPDGKIYCIEPAPENLKLLKMNIKANNFENRFLVSQYLIGDRNGTGELSISAKSNRHSVSFNKEDEHIEVPMITLDTFMDENNISPGDVEFLRMDIEGYEVMAFQGMSKLMNAKTPLKIFIEFHPGWYGRWGWTFERFLDYLESFGLRVKSLAYKGEDGIVTITNPSREEIMATQISPRTINGGCHGFLERS